MAGKVKPIPEGYRNVTPYLIVDEAAKAIDFYRKVFKAKERMRMPAPGGRIGHAELEIGDSVVMLADENPEMNARSPRSVGGSPISLLLYVEDVDATVDRAVAAGAKLKRPVADQFYGDRTGGIEDPFGHQWYLATHVEDVSPEEMRKRSEELVASAK
jgi:PhnB protein